MTKEEKIARYSKLNQEVVPGKMRWQIRQCRSLRKDIMQNI